MELDQMGTRFVFCHSTIYLRQKHTIVFSEHGVTMSFQSAHSVQFLERNPKGWKIFQRKD